MPLAARLRFVVAGLVTASSVLTGCRSVQPSVTREVLVGTYSYVSEDPESRATEHNLSPLLLLPDGTYDLVEGGTSKAVSEKKGIWSVQPAIPSGVEVVLDHAGYPIAVEDNEVRLLVDLDLGSGR